MALGVAALAMLLVLRRWLPRWPRALIVMALSILAVKALDLTSEGVKVTGEVPTGLFSIGLPGADWSGATTALLAGAFSVIFVGYSESLASARMMSLKHGQPIDPDQELIAQGAACGAAGLVGGFATDGSLSKTSVATELQTRGVTLALARVQPSVLELWTRAGAIDVFGPGRLFGTVRGAVNAVTATTAEATS